MKYWPKIKNAKKYAGKEAFFGSGQLVAAVACLHRREHHIDILRPVLEEGLGKRDALGEVEIGFHGLAEHAALKIDTFHLATHQFYA